MTQIIISLKPYETSSPDSQMHNLGNIADANWKDQLALVRGDIKEGRYLGTLEVLPGRKLRKKERDELKLRINTLNQSNPELDPKIIYDKEIQ